MTDTLTPTDLLKDVSLSDDDGLAIPMCIDDAPVSNEATLEAAPIVTPPNQGAYCIAMMGAAGGVGVTSLCIQIAHNLAVESQKKLQKTVRTKEPRVCLIDLDFEGGSCAHHLEDTTKSTRNKQTPRGINFLLILILNPSLGAY